MVKNLVKLRLARKVGTWHLQVPKDDMIGKGRKNKRRKRKDKKTV